MSVKIKLTYEEFKKEFLELFREYMIQKTGVVAETGEINAFYKPHKNTESAVTRMHEFSEKYPDYYERISGEEWDL